MIRWPFFVLDDFENRLESSNNHVPRWETNGVFFCPNPAVQSTEKNQNELYVVLQGQPKCAYEANVKSEITIHAFVVRD